MPVGLFKRDGVIAALAFGAVAVFGLIAPPVALERAAYDLALGLAPERRPDGDVVVVALDDASLAALGPMPWPEARRAELLERIAAGAPRAIGVALRLPEQAPAEVGAGLAALRAAAAAGEPPPVADPALVLVPPLAERADLTPQLDALERSLDPAGPLAAVLPRAGKVVLAAPDVRGDALARAEGGAARLPPTLTAHALGGVVPGEPGLLASLPPPRGVAASDARPAALTALAASLTTPAAAVGFVADAEGAAGARVRPLARAYGGAVLPSFALAVAAIGDEGGLASVGGELSGTVTLGGRALPLEGAAFVRPYYYRAGASAFRTLSASEVLAGRSPADAFSGQLVVVGITAAGVAHTFDTPVDPAMPAVLAEAHLISALRLGDLIGVSGLGLVWQLLALAASGALLYLLFARTRTWIAFAAGGTLLLALALAELLLLVTAATWLPLLMVTQAVGAGLFAVAAKHALEGRSATVTAARGAADLEVGELLRNQGQLDKALERLLRCPPTEGLSAQLYQLGLDLERKRQFSKAALAFERIKQLDASFQDAAVRADRNRALEGQVMIGTMVGTIAPQLLSGDGTQKPRLGRYEIEKEIGKGAMGVVYLGKDPRIGRVVAIKTMPLNQEFEGAELDEMRERFFREAQAAGRLSHPSIVTVYDVGEEHDLAYMAMDYLTGVSLEKHCKAPALLDYDDVFAICIQVAEALDFAHAQRVVHRDIKPANIIWDPQAKRAKLTDFGVACLIDASKTKTGTVLGSPSYMSPEQVAGAHVDGRSDIFSLGVMMYQMLSGELPFKANQMTALMYKIANEKHPDVRNYNPRLPPCAGAIINTALQKEPAKRFPTAGKFAEALKVCRQQKPAY